jgi:hypothetical protein
MSHSFYVGGPTSLAKSGGTISITGYLVPQSFATKGNQPYLYFWALTDDPRYPGVQDTVTGIDRNHSHGNDYLCIYMHWIALLDAHDYGENYERLLVDRLR